MSSTTVPNPANGSFPSRSSRLSAGCKTLHLLEEIWGGLRERPCPKPALLPQVALLPADLPSQANKLEAAFLSAPNNATFFSMVELFPRK